MEKSGDQQKLHVTQCACTAVAQMNSGTQNSGTEVYEGQFTKQSGFIKILLRIIRTHTCTEKFQHNLF